MNNNFNNNNNEIIFVSSIESEFELIKANFIEKNISEFKNNRIECEMVEEFEYVRPRFAKKEEVKYFDRF